MDSGDAPRATTPGDNGAIVVVTTTKDDDGDASETGSSTNSIFEKINNNDVVSSWQNITSGDWNSASGKIREVDSGSDHQCCRSWFCCRNCIIESSFLIV